MALAPGVSRYDAMRNRIKQDSSAAAGGDIDAMRRRFASMGGMNSGAAMKQEQMARDSASARADRSIGDIDIQESAEAERLAEAEKQRSYGTSEREASQKFGAGEAEKSRGFATSERLGSQQFGAGEAEKSRGFATSERLGSEYNTTRERQEGQKFAAGESRLNRDQAGDQFDRTFAEEQSVNLFNKNQAEGAAKKKSTMDRLNDPIHNIFQPAAGGGKSGGALASTGVYGAAAAAGADSQAKTGRAIGANTGLTRSTASPASPRKVVKKVVKKAAPRVLPAAGNAIVKKKFKF